MLIDVDQQDDRLVSVQEQMMRLASEINDAEWEGRDTSHLKERWQVLNAKFMEGVVYEASF